MSILASLLGLLVVVAARLASARTRYFDEHGKNFPSAPLGS